MSSRIEYRPYCVPFLRPLKTAHGVWRERRGGVARWVDSCAAVHYAEAAALPWGAGRESEGRGADLLSAADWAQRLPPLPCDTSAWEVAALLPAGGEAVRALRARRGEGFRTFKWKVGVVRDVEEEWAILEVLCAELPERGQLRLDANGGWSQRVAERWLGRCAEPGLAERIEFIEQPVWSGRGASAGEVRRGEDMLLGLSEDYPTPLALDESVATDEDVRRWLARGWRGLFVIKPTLLTEPRAVLGELARGGDGAGARVVFSSALETAVGARAALRWAFAWEGERRALGFGVYPLFKERVFDGPQAAAVLRWEDVEGINEEAVWNALS